MNERPWDQLPEETDPEYHLFCLWLQEPDRRFRAAGRRLEVNARRMEEYAAVHDWETRARAYDRTEGARNVSALERHHTSTAALLAITLHRAAAELAVREPGPDTVEEAHKIAAALRLIPDLEERRERFEAVMPSVPPRMELVRADNPPERIRQITDAW